MLAAGYTSVPDTPFHMEKVGRSRLGYLVGALRHGLNGYDVVHAHGWLPALITVLKRVRPRMWTPHGWHLGSIGSTAGNPVIRIAKDFLGKFVARSDFDVWIVVCEASRQALLKLGKREKLIHKIPNGVDVEQFYSIERLSSEKKTFLFVGRFDMKVKGIDLLLDAAEGMKKRDDINFLLVGDGPDEQQIRSEITHRSLANVTIEPYSEDLRTHYANAYALVLPSRTEGFPLVLLEAMTAGLPVIASRVGEVDSVAGGGPNSTLVDPGDPVAFTKMVECLADAPDKARDMGEKNREIAQQYDWEKVARMVERVYGEAAE